MLDPAFLGREQGCFDAFLKSSGSMASNFVTGSYIDEMTHRRDRRVGRRKKEEALLRRDQYLARYLRELHPKHSYAAVERQLAPDHAKRDESNGRLSQPDAWSKRAKGARGISDSLEGKFHPVEAAEREFPGSGERFYSLLWAALWWAGDWTRNFPKCGWPLGKELRCMLGVDKFQPNGALRLSFRDISRLQEMKPAHPDALGYLLLHTDPLLIWNRPLSHAARHAAAVVFDQLVQQDAAFSSLKAELESLISLRFPGVLQPPLSELSRSSVSRSRTAEMRTQQQRRRKTQQPLRLPRHGGGSWLAQPRFKWPKSW